MAEDLVQFDVLVAPEGEGPGRAPPRPSRARLEECRRWFADHGAACHPTGFGLACTMAREAAEQLFGARLSPGADLRAPPEIRHLVLQITVPKEPELF